MECLKLDDREFRRLPHRPMQLARLQIAAARLLERLRDDDVGGFLLSAWWAGKCVDVPDLPAEGDDPVAWAEAVADHLVERCGLNIPQLLKLGEFASERVNRHFDVTKAEVEEAEGNSRAPEESG